MRYREIRYPSDMGVRVEHGHEVSRACLANVSPTGARLSETGRLPNGALVMICHLDFRIAAQVVWSNDLQTGVRFARPLSSAEVQVLRGATGRAGVGPWATNPMSYRELG